MFFLYRYMQKECDHEEYKYYDLYVTTILKLFMALVDESESDHCECYKFRMT